MQDGSSPTVSYGWKGGGAGGRQISVRWADRLLAQQQCVGYSFAQTSGGVRRLRREIPEPLSPTDTTFFCTKANLVRGKTWTGRAAYDRTTLALLPGYPNKDPNPDADGDDKWKLNEYEEAWLSLEFAQADFSILPDSYIDTTGGGIELYRFVTYRDDRCASYVTVRGGTLYYVLPQLPGEQDRDFKARRRIPFSVGKVEGRKTLYLKWHQVAADAVPLQTIDNLIGKTNKTQFVSPAYPAGTLLFLPPRVERYVMANGAVGCDVEFVMDYFKEGQLKLLFPGKDGTFIDYFFVTSDPAIVVEPTFGALPPKKFLHDEAEFLDAFDVNNP